MKPINTCCKQQMMPVSFNRGSVCLICGATLCVAPHNKSIEAELARASDLVKQGRNDLIPVDTRIN